MENDIAIQVQSHTLPLVTYDTIERIQSFLTKNVSLIIDGTFWEEFYPVKFPCKKICGFNHNHHTSSYRNQILGLSILNQIYPNKEWYGHIEWDVLINDNRLVSDLKQAKNHITAGFNLRTWDQKWRLLSKITGQNVEKTVYYLGCCIFFRGDFIRKCIENKWFEEILKMSKIYQTHWDDYKEYSVDEAMLPSLASSISDKNFCFGNEETITDYAVRYRPEWKINEVKKEWSVIHPLKIRN